MKKSFILAVLTVLFGFGTNDVSAFNHVNDGVDKCNTEDDDSGTEPGLSYLKAKQEAELKDMKYVLYFKADWCTPCKWMEETTFLDPAFINAIDNTFIFVPLDIDAFEGYALKEYFQVHSLPTMLVFNDDHEIVNRSEGSLSTTSFFNLLENEMELASTITSNQSKVVNTRPLHTNIAKETSITRRTDDVVQHQTELPAEIIESVTHFSVQLGAFSSLVNAKAIQDQVSQYTSETIHITTIPKGDKVIYKVFAGKLQSQSQADQLKRSLTSYGIDGFVTTFIASLKS